MTQFYFQVKPCAEFLLRFPAIEWVVILNENTNFYLKNFMDLVQESEWNSSKDTIFMVKEIRR